MAGFISNYIIVVPAVIAVINGFVAVLMANFFKENLPAQIVWVGLAALLSIMAIGATIYGQYHVLQVHAQKESQKRTIREALGVFLWEGQLLLTKCGNETVPPPDAEAEAWAQKVEKFLHENLDDSYVARFRNGAGLPLAANSIQSIPHRKLWSGINVRTSRLIEFIQDLSR